MRQDDFRDIVEQTVALVRGHYVFPQVAEQVAGVLTEGLATGRYFREGDDLVHLAGLVTDDMQGVNGDLHLRLLHHVEPLPEAHGDDDADLAAIARWADATGRGVARVERLAGNVAHLDLRPLLFPPIVAGEAIAAAMNLVATAEVLILDLRGCLGGEPTMVAVVCSYLVGDEPVELSGFYERVLDRTRQLWTLPFVPGRRLGAGKPVYVLTSASTFSGGEALAYDLQQMGRATVVGERTRGGAHPRRGFRVHAHLEATIPVARAVSPISGSNWEGSGVTPDIEVPADVALETAYRRALKDVTGRTDDAQPGTVAEARQALADSA